MRRKSH